MAGVDFSWAEMVKAPHPSSTTTADDPLLASLVVDAAGAVVATNTSARELWGATKRTLVNTPLVDLVLAAGVDAIASSAIRWEALRRAGLDRFIPVDLRPVDGAPVRPMRLRLERAHGGGGSYIALIVPR